MKTNKIFAAIIAAFVMSSCNDEPYLYTKGEVAFDPSTPVESSLEDVLGYECELNSSLETNASSVNSVTTITKAYSFNKEFSLIYSDDTEKNEIKSFNVEHSFTLTGLTGALSGDAVSEIAGKTFNVDGNKVSIANREVLVNSSKSVEPSFISYANKTQQWIFTVDQQVEGWNAEGTVFNGSLCSNYVRNISISFGDAEKVAGSDNTYNVPAHFTASMSEGDDVIYDFSVVFTTSEKDEVFYAIENLHQEGNEVVFDGVEGHTLHPELNNREEIRKPFEASLKAGNLISYNTLNSVGVANQNANIFRYEQGEVTLTATYPKEVVVEYHGISQTYSVPTPVFAEVNREEAASEDADFNYINTTITYAMSWDVVVASATQAFQGRVEKEKDAVVRIYLDYTEKNGAINGKLIEEHSIDADKVLLTFSGNREFSVRAENLITLEAENNQLTRTNHEAGSWVKSGNYQGNNLKGDKMSATFVHTYNSTVKNNVVVSMNRNLYVEYAGKKYEIADPETTLNGAAPVAGTVEENTVYDLFHYSVVYTATAEDMRASATQEFVVKVKKPEHTIPGWEVDEAYAQHFATTYSWSEKTGEYNTFHGLVFRNINDHNQKMIAVFQDGNAEVPFRQAYVSTQELDNFLQNNPNRYISVNNSTADNSEVAYLGGDFSKKDDSYKNGFCYVTIKGQNKSFGIHTISVNNLPEPFRGQITKSANGFWGGMWF